MEDLDGDLQNYFRLALLVNDTTKFLQQLFRIHFKKLTGTTWEDTNEFGEMFVASAIGRKSYDSAKKIQKKLLESGDISTFDIPLLFSLFNTIDFGETEMEKLEMKEMRNAIKSLVEVRNQLAHITTLSLSTEEFAILHEKSKIALNVLGGEFDVKKEPSEESQEEPIEEKPLDEFKSSSNPKVNPEMPECQNFVNPTPTYPSPNPNDDSYAALKYWDHRVPIQIQAKAGSVYAKSLTEAMDYFSTGMKALIKLQERNCQNDKLMLPNMIGQFAQCFRLADYVAIFTQDVRNNFELIIDKVLSTCSSTTVPPSLHQSSIDLDTRVCKSFLMLRQLKPPENILEFLKLSKEIYPNEIYFHRAYCHKLKQLGRFHQSAEAVADSLILHPTDVDLLWIRAQTLKLGRGIGNESGEIEQKYQIIRSAYSKFLQAAPSDHRYVPEAYYALAHIIVVTEAMKQQEIDKKKPKKINIIHTQLSEQGEESMTLFYQIGLTVENNLSPCFLPYESQVKKKLQIRVNMKMNKDESSTGKSQAQNGHSSKNFTKDTPSQKSDDLQSKLVSPQRLEILIPHRIRVSNYHTYTAQRKENIETKNGNGLEDLLAKYFRQDDQKAPTDLTNLKNITLNEMDPEKDHVYKNHVIKLTIMEDTLFDYYDCIHTVVSDGEGNFQRCTFSTSTFNPNDEEVKKFLSFGSTLSIMNPYFCLMTFGGAGLLVSDPKSVIYHSSGRDEPKCRFCGRSKPIHGCECQVLYCSRLCQMKDWNPLNHYVICTHHNEGLRRLIQNSGGGIEVVEKDGNLCIRLAGGVILVGIAVMAGVLLVRFKQSS